ncbi:MAG: inorganic phosphate transporter family protein [Desulfurococcales archaeon]|nr:inorganic phosphate transporter family protein [Desulfurococcales archaeon]MCE4623068.1 inorganic phosphate transporter family protein [Desulfurococcales archaeon]MCE4627241.1 inorganic phosphate transporter family protein [Desulfurococcales archaeon]MCE4629965.1 inorganic phosphate transporter family protein [Desulfurococcales archaeon]
MDTGGEILVILGLVAAFYMAWNLGANDAANPTDTAVGSGAVSLKKAILLFSIFAVLGAVLQGYRVIKTIGKGVVKDLDPAMALSASLAAGLWVTLATRKGLPVSTTHSTVGAVLGVGFARGLMGGEAKIDWNVVLKVVASWITSPLGAILLAFILYYAFATLYRALNGRGWSVDRIFQAILIFNLAFSAYAFGANDVGNATGVYVGVVSSTLGVPDDKTLQLLAVLGGLGIMAGAFTWGYRVIMTVGFKITKLDYVSGAAAELANASVVYLYTLWGMPVSTTHASVSSVIGVGIAKGKGLSGIDKWTVLMIIAGWLATVPVAAGIAASIYTLISIV